METAERAMSNLRACLKDKEGALEVTSICAVCSWSVKQLQVVEKKRIIQVFQKQHKSNCWSGSDGENTAFQRNQ